MPAAVARSSSAARSQFIRAQAFQKSSACFPTSQKNMLLNLLRRVLQDVSMEVGRYKRDKHPVLSIKGFREL